MHPVTRDGERKNVFKKGATGCLQPVSNAAETQPDEPPSAPNLAVEVAC